MKAASMAIADVVVGVLAVDVAFLVLVLAGVTSPGWGTCLIVGAAAMGAASWFDEAVVHPAIEKV